MTLYTVHNRDTDQLVMIAPVRVIATFYKMHRDAERPMEANPNGASFYPRTSGDFRLHLWIQAAGNFTYDRL